jgi:hypothetical protein
MRSLPNSPPARFLADAWDQQLRASPAGRITPESSSRRVQTRKYAVDGWLLASGKPPEITEVEKWYIDDNDILFGANGKVASAGEPQKK